MVDLATVRTWFDQEQRIDIDYPDMLKESSPEIVRFIRPKPGMSFIAYSRLAPDRADQVIQAQVDELRRRDLNFTWKVCDHDSPADLGQRLAGYGFSADETEAVMLLDLEHAPPSLLAPSPGDVRRLDRPAQLEDVIQVETEVWGGDFSWMRRRLGQHMHIPGYLEIFVAYANGQPAAAAWAYLHAGSRFATFWGGSTVAEYRGRGLYTALLAARTQLARARGYRFAVVDAGPMSQPILTRHSFRQMTTTVDYTWPSAETAAAPSA
jgi:GNAT superfamily N-acetyltransferase